MKTIVLLDNSYFNFYRYFATMKWWSFRSKEIGTIGNPDFIGSLDSQYLKNLKLLSKITGVDHQEFFAIKDSERSTLWRTMIYPEYKGHRVVECVEPVGSGDASEEKCAPDVLQEVFRYLNLKFMWSLGPKIRLPRLEADDIIAVMTKMYSELGCRVFIVSGDKDFIQLMQYPNVEVIDAAGKPRVIADPGRYLHRKILKGDPSDNIRAVKYPWSRSDSESAWEYIMNSILIDFDYIPRFYQNQIIRFLDSQRIIDLSKLEQDYNPKKIQLGLCCINSELEGVCCARKPIIRTVESLGLEYLYTEVEKNIRDLAKMIDWNHRNGVRVLRVSSGLVPHASNRRVAFGTLNRFQHLFEEIGSLARKYKQRLTFHPGQYNVIGSPNQEAFENTVLDLEYHAEVLDRMGCDQDSVMVVHGGGLYSDPKGVNITRWSTNFKTLSGRIQRRLVLENDEKSYNIEDCLEISRLTGIPVVFDTHHHECYVKSHPGEALASGSEYLARILATWQHPIIGFPIKPKFHVSKQASNGRLGCHSDYVETIPEYLLSIPEVYDIEIDIMIEAKAKEKALRKLYERYPEIDPFIIDV